MAELLKICLKEPLQGVFCKEILKRFFEETNEKKTQKAILKNKIQDVIFEEVNGRFLEEFLNMSEEDGRRLWNNPCYILLKNLRIMEDSVKVNLWGFSKVMHGLIIEGI